MAGFCLTPSPSEPRGFGVGGPVGGALPKPHPHPALRSTVLFLSLWVLYSELFPASNPRWQLHVGNRRVGRPGSCRSRMHDPNSSSPKPFRPKSCACQGNEWPWWVCKLGGLAAGPAQELGNIFQAFSGFSWTLESMSRKGEAPPKPLKARVLAFGEFTMLFGPHSQMPALISPAQRGNGRVTTRSILGSAPRLDTACLHSPYAVISGPLSLGSPTP